MRQPTSPEKRRALLQRMLRAEGLGPPAAGERLERRPGGGPAPLSAGQSRLWFVDRWERGLGSWALPLAVRLRGALDVEALRRALEEVVRRHDALRTVFRDEAGEPRQVVLPPGPLELPVSEVAGAAAGEALRAFAERPFDLAAGPLHRELLLRAGEREHVLAVCLHHIVADGWSIGVLLRELSALYGGAALPPLSLQYPDYAAWQRRWLEGPGRAQVEARVARLRGVAPLDLPCDFPRPPRPPMVGDAVTAQLAPATAAAVERLAQSAGATPFMVLLAGYAALLRRWSGQDDFAVGTPVAGRGRAELEPLIGFFVNTAVLRVDASGDPAFGELLARARAAALEALSQQDAPFEQVVEALRLERDLSRTPIFQVGFALNQAPPPPSLPGLEVEPFEVPGTSVLHDLDLTAVEDRGRYSLHLAFRPDLFERATAERMLAQLQALLAAAAERPGCRLSELPLMDAEERARVVRGWNDTAAPLPNGTTLHQMVRAQAERTPDAPAVWMAGESLSYRELARRADALAGALVRRGVRLEEPVGVQVPRSLELPVALLAVMQAGGACLPLDPSLPEERRRFMVEDAGARLVVGPEDLRRAEGAGGARREVSPDAVASILYTSGSTGAPKGVMLSHRGLANRFLWNFQAYPLGPEDRVLQPHSCGFDISIWEIFAPLCAGASTVLLPPGEQQDPAAVVRRMRERSVTVAAFVPSMLQALLDEEGFGAVPLRQLYSGGEALSADLRARFFARHPRCRLLDMYGPTETCIAVTFDECAPERARPSIGRPLPNTRAYVVGERMQACPVGVPGELLVGGVQLARGYLGRAELTAERFVPDPFSGEAGARLYRTGDRARWRADGTLEYLGRVDEQVKVRGHRVEPGEVRAVLGAQRGVKEVAVVARGLGANAALVAYFVPAEESPATVEALRAACQARLPAFMVPSAFVAMEALPLTANAKLDRARLPDPGEAARPAFAAPLGEVEEGLAAAWAECLKVERVGRDDDFFALGGHSLLAPKVLAQVGRRFGVELPLPAIFEAPTVAKLARRLEAARERPERGGALVALRREGARPPLFLVHGVDGSVSPLRALAEALGPEQPVYVLAAEAPRDGLAAIAGAYLAEIRAVAPRGPYRLGGWSMGGLVAWEMARRLEAAGESVDALVLIDTYPLPADLPAPSDAELLEAAQEWSAGNRTRSAPMLVPPARSADSLRATARAVAPAPLLDSSRASAPTDPAPLLDSSRASAEETVAQRLVVARALLAVMAEFVPAPLRAAVHWLRAEGTRPYAAAARDAYARAGVNPSELELAGDHHSILAPPHAGALAAAIHAALRAPASNASRGDAP